MLNIHLTSADVEDLRNGDSINAAADDGTEVLLFASYFGPPAWAIIGAGEAVIMEASVIKSTTTGIDRGSWAEVRVTA